MTTTPIWMASSWRASSGLNTFCSLQEKSEQLASSRQEEKAAEAEMVNARPEVGHWVMMNSMTSKL